MVNELDNYTITDLISNCNDGTIYKAIDHTSPSTPIAIRIIPNELISPSKLIALKKEITILNAVSHDNIIKLKNTRITKKYYCLIFEYCNDGNLATFIQTQQTITETSLRHIIKQIVEALEALHSMNIVHNNLCLSNILLTRKGDTLKIKLSDFRSAQFVKSEKKDFHYDILDMGCILQKLMSGNTQNNLNNNRNLSKDCHDFLKKCFQISTIKHFSLKDVKVHPFIGINEGRTNKKNNDWLLVNIGETREVENEFEMVDVGGTASDYWL